MHQFANAFKLLLNPCTACLARPTLGDFKIFCTVFKAKQMTFCCAFLSDYYTKTQMLNNATDDIYCEK